MPPKKKQRISSKRRIRWPVYLLGSFFMFTWVTVLVFRFVNPPVTAFMLLQNQSSGVRNTYDYQWTDWSELGSTAALAVMAAEDQKFPDHHGFDVEAIHKAVVEQIEGSGFRGASTITQQVAKNLFLWPGRSYFRKLIEAYFAAIIEITWPKQRILEMYLNIAEFGHGIYGIPAASRHFFGKRPAQLTDTDSALLAAVLPNPKKLHVNNPSSYVRERQRWIIQYMRRLRRDGWLERVKA
jgi:monofunctional biosynthetic peptidoglycan transglycosylase